MPNQPTAHTCPACEGTGTVTAIVRAATPRMVSPCEMEGEIECPTCDGRGEIEEANCGECEETYDLSADPDAQLDVIDDRVLYTCPRCRQQMASADAQDRALEVGR